MTLRFDTTKGKPDTRQIEYEQSIVRLGLEKAEVEKEVGKVKTELSNVEKRRDEVSTDVEELKRVAKLYDDRRIELQNEITEMLRKASAETSSLKDRVEGGEAEINEKREELKKVEEHIGFLAGEIKLKNEKISELQEKITKLKEELASVRSELNHVKRELDEAQADLKKAITRRVEEENLLEEIVKEKLDVEAQVSILKSDNKGGLDVLASLEGERVRLKARDESLDRKAADLLVYENRLSKRAKELGVDLNMTFT